jgi:membrane protein DedA with SNARE-associated domain
MRFMALVIVSAAIWCVVLMWVSVAGGPVDILALCTPLAVSALALLLVCVEELARDSCGDGRFPPWGP